MTTTEKYYELAFEIEINKSQISFLEQHPEYKVELNVEQKKRIDLESQFEVIKNELLKKNETADNTRIALIKVINGVLDKITRIKKWPNYYPDLNQGMVIPGYLFGKILDDLKFAVKSEGNYYPVPQIYMSEKQWDYLGFEIALNDFRQELMENPFVAQMNGVEFYEKIKNSFVKIMEDLRSIGIM